MSERALTLAVAGHVDHGKTALTAALTGVQTDRLPEERRRGLSIQPGFAPLQLPSGRRISVIDLPGHERFVRHMVGGASGVDAALLCVAAHDGVMPQTREHLDVLRLLEVPLVAVAVTFADRADPAAAAVTMSALCDAPATAVSAPRGDGVPQLARRLDRSLAALASRAEPGPARLPVDRCFSVAGAGTVVTGTLLGGSGLAVGDLVRVEPSGAPGRIRRIEVHDGSVERAVGGRVALNLAGVDRAAGPPGSTVVLRDSRLIATDRTVVDLLNLSSAPRRLKGRERLQAFVGTCEVPARLRLLGDARGLDPGQTGPVELALEGRALVMAGDTIVLRSADPATVAGGRVLVAGHEPEPTRAEPATPNVGGQPPEHALRAVAQALAASGRSGADVGSVATAVPDVHDPRPALSALRARGEAAESGGLWFHRSVVEEAAAVAADTWTSPERTLGDLRAGWGVNRRVAEALARLLDARGTTQRRGPVRVLRRGAHPARTNGGR